jgi:hypothetical protein
MFSNDDDLSKYEDPVKYNSWRASRLIEETQQLLNSQQMERQAAERQAAERQAAERQAAERQASERQAVERRVAERQEAERQAALARVVVSSNPFSITTPTVTTVLSSKDSPANIVTSSESFSNCIEHTVQSPPDSSLPTTLPIIDHSPGDVYTIPEEEEETTSPIGSDGVTSLRRRGGQ